MERGESRGVVCHSPSELGNNLGWSKLCHSNLEFPSPRGPGWSQHLRQTLTLDPELKDPELKLKFYLQTDQVDTNRACQAASVGDRSCQSKPSRPRLNVPCQARRQMVTENLCRKPWRCCERKGFDPDFASRPERHRSRDPDSLENLGWG